MAVPPSRIMRRRISGVISTGYGSTCRSGRACRRRKARWWPPTWRAGMHRRRSIALRRRPGRPDHLGPRGLPSSARSMRRLVISGRLHSPRLGTVKAKGHAMAKNTICIWYDKDAEAAARFYAETFPDSAVGAIHRAPSDYPSGKKGDVLTVEFKVAGVYCIGLNGGPAFKHNEAFSFQMDSHWVHGGWHPPRC